ncbi:phage scaffold protein [Streptococcus pneumoniae]|uniref:capsid assembly scaffolding protein Gp46 family protein n=1 Tax=Streptococcus pneumoniae TaxID=1313 RepID=UPI0007696ABF|nr:phage scaffold protein [Streptococcus pneumoniae]
MSEEINATVSTESTETVDTQGNVDSVQEEKHERTFTRAEIGKMLSAERSKWEAEQAEAKAMLSERDLPVELVNVVDLTSAETVSQSVAVLQKSWEQAVQKGVQEKLKGGAPMKQAPVDSDGITKEEFARMGYQSRNELYQKNPELYKKLKG